MTFGVANGGGDRSGKVDDNYFQVCRHSLGSPEAEKCLTGFQKLLRGELDNFEMEYPCHSPTEERWFLLQARRLSAEQKNLLVMHINITQRKIQELRNQT